jgi:glycine hydroxymethyltransferase
MGKPEMREIASLISRAIASDEAAVLAQIRKEVHALTARFPIYTS